MVEENLKFGVPTWSKIKDFNVFDKKASPWLKKILKFEVPTCSKYRISSYIYLVRGLHHG